MTYIFDLDGTLIDSSERMYRLFCYLVPQCRLSKEEYWNFKRDKVNHEKLLSMLYTEIDFEDFNERWMSLIENKEYIDLDKNYPDAVSTLEELKKENKLYLLTARQSKEMLMYELGRLRLNVYFDAVFTTENRKSKECLLKECITKIPDFLSENTIFVSDMGKDIILGNRMHYHTIGITHGFMSRKRLRGYNPCRMIDGLNELLE